MIMPFEKLETKTELAMGINDTNFLLFSWLAFYTALRCSDTINNFVPEEESARLASLWEVSTTASYDMLTSLVGDSKLTLEESFNARANILVASDEYSRAICVPEKWATIKS